MNRRWITVGLCALLCAAQVWAKPTDDDKGENISYVDDDAELEDSDDTYDDSESSDLSSAPIQVITKPETFSVLIGSNVFLPCDMLNADNVMISWMKDNEMLYAGDSKMSSDERIERLKNNTLLIRNVRVEDSSDKYMCKALDAKTPGEVTHRLIVKPPRESEDEKVRVVPQEYLEINQGESVTIGCETPATLQPKVIAWSRKGKRLNIDNKTDNGIYLHIRNATRHLAGDYQCLVETGAKQPIIRHLKLRVKHVPEIEYDKEEIGEKIRDRDTFYTGLGVESNITCVVHSHPPVLKLQWLKDEQKIGHDDRFIKSSINKTHHLLTIKSTSSSDLGRYQCRASNILGNSTGPPIYLLDTPDRPVFQSGKVVDDSIEFRWEVVSYMPIVESELRYRKKGEHNWRDGEDEKVISGNGKGYIVQGKISGIEPGKYEVKLRARNDMEHSFGDKMAKWGPFSEPEKFDGEYKDDTEAESVRGSAMRPTISFMTLLFMISQLAYSCS